MTSPKRIPSLHGLRAMSILCVIIGHRWHRSAEAVLLSGFGVVIFFVLSGYLITRLLQEERERTGRIHLAAFYRRRCFRIFPAALTYMLVIALLYPVARPALVYAATLHGVLSPVKHSERISSSLVTVG